jgi:hypothetical protein
METTTTFAEIGNNPTADDTSRAAHEDALRSGRKQGMACRIHDLLLHRYPRGLTCDEIEQELGGRHQTISARCADLKAAGCITSSGTRSTRGRQAALVHFVSPCIPFEAYGRYKRALADARKASGANCARLLELARAYAAGKDPDAAGRLLDEAVRLFGG